MAEARPPLHIGIDARELTGRPTGVGRYLGGLVRAWLDDRDRDDRLTLFLPSPPAEPLFGGDRRITVVVPPSASSGTWWEQAILPTAVARAAPDVLLSPGYTAPLRLVCPSVLAIHDLSFFAHPEWFSWREGNRRRWITRLAARRASKVITISRFSAGEIVRYLGVSPGRIVLAPPGVVIPPEPTPSIPREPIVLFVGSLFNRRRLPEMIGAFAITARDCPGARLVLVGDNRTMPGIDPMALAASHGIGDRVEWRAYATDAELESLYWRARVFLFLSDYEGFAMTPAEALAHGTPPVLLDTPVAREVYADAASLVSADPPAIARALTRLLQDDAAHETLLAAGRRRIRTFSWPATAAIVRDALRRAADRT